MQSSEMLRKIFLSPRAVFSTLKTERKWVPAVVFMVLLLGIHSIVTQFATYSDRRVIEITGSQSPDTSLILDPNGQEIADGAKKSEQIDLELTNNAPASDVNGNQVGRFIVWLFVLVGLLPVAFGIVSLMCLIEAVYFRVVGALLQLDFRLGDWFVFSVWSRVPAIALGVVAIIVGAVALGRQPDRAELEVLSLARWVDLPEARYGGENWTTYIKFDNLDASLIWVVALQTIGFQEWSGRGSAFSLGVVLIPTLTRISLSLFLIFLV